MSEKFPRVTAKRMIKALGKLGFVFSRQSGSHKIYKNSENKRVTVPLHSKQTLHPKVLRSILDDADIMVEDLRKMLKSRP